MKVLASYINPIGIENKILEYCQIPIPNRYEEVGNPHYMYLKWYIYIYIDDASPTMVSTKEN